MVLTPTNQLPQTPFRRRRWPRLLIGSCAVVIVVVGGYFVAYGVALARASADLRAAIAEVDAAEPGGWQLEDLEARRPQVPDGKNGSKVLLELVPLFPEDWQAPKWVEEFPKLRPCELLDEDAVATLKEQLAPLEQVRAKARNLASYPTGRFPSSPMTAEFAFDNPPQCKLVGKTIDVLFADGVLLIHQNDMELACQSAYANVNAARSLASELRAQAQLFRQASHWRAILLAERMLGQGTLSEERLVHLRQLFEEEAAINLTPHTLACERAAFHRFFLALESGELDFTRVAHHRYGTHADLIFCSLGLTGSMVRNSHAYILRYLTKGLAASTESDFERKNDLLHAWKVELAADNSKYKVPRLAMHVAAPGWIIARSELRTKAHLGCAIAGLAAERYRLRRQGWPKSLDDLVTDGMLKSVPLDPLDGKALTLRATEDGIVIYSAAYSKDYHGDARDAARSALNVGEDFFEFRLWNEAKRHQPKPPEDER